MSIGFIILLLTVFFIVNTYYDGKYTKLLLSWKKYYKMIFIGILGLGLYLIMKKDPKQGKNILLHANNMVKYMPIDRGTLSMLNPILDFTAGRENKGGGFIENKGGGFMENYENNMNSNIPWLGQEQQQQEPTKKATKRSVSETKKKYVAYRQDWKCGNCGQKLNHTFEIDHKKRLEYGGTNDESNLVALCRNCHGSKTAMENM